MTIKKFINLVLSTASGAGTITLLNFQNQSYPGASKIYFKESYVISSAANKIYLLEIPNLINDVSLTNIASKVVIPLYLGYSFVPILCSNNAGSYLHETYAYNIYEASTGSITSDTMTISLVFTIED